MADGAAVVAVLKNKMKSAREQITKLNSDVFEKTKLLRQEEDTLGKAELEVSTMLKRIRELEDELESTESRLTEATAKLEEASKAADESDRCRRYLEIRQTIDDNRMEQLVANLRETERAACESQVKCQEATAKLAIAESDLEVYEDKLQSTETRIRDLESELHAVTNRLKSVEISESKATRQRAVYEQQLITITKQVEEAEARYKAANRMANDKRMELSKLEEALEAERMNHMNLRQEMDNIFEEVANI